MILMMAFVLPNGVYKQWPLNVLESAFFINLGVVSGLVAVFCCTGSVASSEVQTPYFVYPSVAITMVLFAVILTYHCTKRLCSYRCCQTLRLLAVVRRVNLLRFKTYNIQKESHEEQEIEPFLNQSRPQVVRFSRYREPLIEG